MNQTPTVIPTPEAVVVDIRSYEATRNTVSEGNECCSTPAGVGIHGEAVHRLSVGILVISCIALLFGPYSVYGSTGGWSDDLAITRFVVYLTAIVTSSVVVCAPGRSKSFYSTCAFLYLVVGALGLVTVVAWVSSDGVMESSGDGPSIVLTLAPGILCSIFSLLGFARAFKAARTWETTGNAPQDATVAVIGTPVV